MKSKFTKQDLTEMIRKVIKEEYEISSIEIENYVRRIQKKYKIESEKLTAVKLFHLIKDHYNIT